MFGSIVGALVGGPVGAIIGSGVDQRNAAKDAERAQQAGLNRSIDFQQGIFDQIREDQTPVRDARNVALSLLMAEIGLGSNSVETSNGTFNPTVTNKLTAGDQFAIDEGIKATQIATGGQVGGNALRALSERSQNIASLSRDNRLNRLQNIVTGQGASVSNSNNQLAAVGGNIAGGYQAQGDVRASGIANRNNAVTGTVGNLLNLGMFAAGGF